MEQYFFLNVNFIMGTAGRGRVVDQIHVWAINRDITRSFSKGMIAILRY